MATGRRNSVSGAAKAVSMPRAEEVVGPARQAAVASGAAGEEEAGVGAARQLVHGAVLVLFLLAGAFNPTLAASQPTEVYRELCVRAENVRSARGGPHRADRLAPE